MSDDLILPCVNQDSRFWLRLIVGGQASKGSQPLDNSEATYRLAKIQMRNYDEGYCYNPIPEAVLKPELKAEFPCHLPGGYLPFEIDAVIDSAPDVPLTPIFNISIWSNYWKNKRKKKEEDDE